jgi:uncharacterized protein (DUF983 family)
MDLTPRRLVPLVWRAVRLRCPNCGAGGLWRDWFHLRRACPTCGLHLERGEHGYIVGAQMFNIIAAELLFAAIFVGVLVATLPDAPWTWLQYGGPALMIIFPVFFYPFSKTLFLAFDLVFRPPTAQDFTERSPS